MPIKTCLQAMNASKIFFPIFFHCFGREFLQLNFWHPPQVYDDDVWLLLRACNLLTSYLQAFKTDLQTISTEAKKITKTFV